MKPSPQAAQALAQLFSKALLLRLGLAALLHFVVDENTFAPDQRTYHAWSAQLAQYWAGDTLIYPGRLTLQGEPIGYFWIVASLYFALGAWALLPKLVNAVVGAFVVKLVFDLALRITHDERVALKTATYCAFFPSLILWSTLNIRDVWVVVLIVLVCRQVLVVQEQPKLSSVILLGGATYAITLFRPYMLFAVALPMLLSFLVRNRANLLRNTVLGMLLAGAVIYADASAGIQRRMRVLDFEELNASRRWSAGAAESGFERGVDISTPEKALAFLPIGLTYFLLAPFPWSIANFKQAFTLPEMLYFYWLLPSILRGIGILVRRHLASSLTILLICAGVTFGYAVGQGNVGTIYRHRAQVLPFFLMFAAVGVAGQRNPKRSTAAALRSERVPLPS